MKYKPRAVNTSSTVVTGANAATAFCSSLPSTWPIAPDAWDASLIPTFRSIFQESILDEIKNVIDDIKKHNPDLRNRGHVIAIVLMVALDAVSGYAYRGKSGKRIESFITNHFPQEYRAYSSEIGELYRNCLIHNWNLFEVSICASDESITRATGNLSFGLLNFFQALQLGVDDFLRKLETDVSLQSNSLKCYRRLRQSAKP